MADLFIILIILLAVCAAGRCIYKAKKRGQMCMGCCHDCLNKKGASEKCTERQNCTGDS
ncbi:MAG: FeoB-associated Cys-rich membrane protein [Clostridia bacterium]|nr:FeoB-associated Cys-rich membrane protein [Clostridia bacterium]